MDKSNGTVNPERPFLNTQLICTFEKPAHKKLNRLFHMLCFTLNLVLAILYFIAAFLLFMHMKSKASCHYCPTQAVRCLFYSTATLGSVYFLWLVMAFSGNGITELFRKEDFLFRIALTGQPAQCILCTSIESAHVRKSVIRNSVVMFVLLFPLLTLADWFIQRQSFWATSLFQLFNVLCLTSISAGLMFFYTLTKNLKYHYEQCKIELRSFKIVIGLLLGMSLVAYVFVLLGHFFVTNIFFLTALPVHMAFLVTIVTHSKSRDYPAQRLEEAPPGGERTALEVLNQENEKINKVYLDIYNRMLLYIEEEHPYKSPYFTRGELASAIGTNITYISCALRQHSHQNFRQFLNAYRIKYAQDYYIQFPNTRLIELCNVSGFRSLSAFNQAFQINVGTTPGDWCKKNAKKPTQGEKRGS